MYQKMDKLIKCFINEPYKSFHVRGLARIVDKSPTTVSKYLKGYEKEGYISSKRMLNHILYQAQVDNVGFKDLKKSYNIVQIRKSGMLDYLVEVFQHPEAVILFGSYGKGEDGVKSDVDLLVISSKKQQVSLSRFERKLGKVVDLHVKSRSDIEKMKNKNEELLNNFINGVVLEGFWRLFR